jgi:hypothetical protein
MKWIEVSASGEISGLSHRKNGTINREVCSADIRSLESMKITTSQISNGSQYFRKRRIRLLGSTAADTN